LREAFFIWMLIIGLTFSVALAFLYLLEAENFYFFCCTDALGFSANLLFSVILLVLGLIIACKKTKEVFNLNLHALLHLQL